MTSYNAKKIEQTNNQDQITKEIPRMESLTKQLESLEKQYE